MKKITVKILTVFLCFALLLPAISITALAGSGIGSTDSLDTSSVSAWESAITNPVSKAIDILGGKYGLTGGVFDASDVFWAAVDGVLVFDKVGQVSLYDLNSLCVILNSYFGDYESTSLLNDVKNELRAVGTNSLALALGLGSVHFEVQQTPSKMYRIKEVNQGLWIVNSKGQYPCAEVLRDGTTIDGDTGAATSKWVDARSFSSTPDTSKVNMVSYDTLSAMCAILNDRGVTCKIVSFGNYKAIAKYATSTAYYYADANGQVFACWANESQSATSQDRPDTTIKDINGDVIQIEGDITDNSSNIDLSNMTITLPTGQVFIADNIVYDESMKTYYIDSHDVTNYNITFNYTWTYHINYTSITYIGQTEEYNKYYEVYYELPDGRDSADLTKEEVEQLNVSIDVIPYGRSADDTSLRSLYHFDGDTKDSSYWNYCTDFTWNKGASLTYMDASVFNGALYLDETEHDFTMTLPSGLGSGAFTLQFRYYQSYTAAPQTDSYISLGDTQVMKFTGSQFLNASGTVLANTPIGSWNELAIMREGSTLRYYLNGVQIGTDTVNVSFNDKITFHFGGDQQTYKYFDELRVLNYALSSDGANYTPTSVPHDTNLSLVLPTDSTPLADEYWIFDTSITPVKAFDMTTGEDVFGSTASVGKLDVTTASVQSNAGYTSVTGGSGTASRSIGVSCNSPYLSASGSVSTPFGPGLTLLLSTYGYFNSNNATMPSSFVSPKSVLTSSGTYTLSVVMTDGTVYPFTFSFSPYFPSQINVTSTSPSCSTVSSKSFDWGTISVKNSVGINYSGSTSGSAQNWAVAATSVSINPNAGTTIDIAYIELVAGDTPNTGHERVTSVTAMTPDQLNTPTLAVRTDLDITSYQIGGVRPSLPTKGQVWALVENERITSIQIYNGSAWEACDGRIWTGERWVPASSYNIITLQDMYDIVDATQNYEYIYTESGFWSWWQKAWIAFTEKLFAVLGGSGTTSGCQHVYAITSEKEATCTDPGERKYTCSLCGNEYIEEIPALGHDWLVSEDTETTYSYPEDTCCPDCSETDFAVDLDESSGVYTFTCNSCGTSWTVQAEVTYGQTTYTCSRCGESYVESKDPESGLFDSIGNFIADGITWAADKLVQLVESLTRINEIFSGFVETIKEKAGDYPAFLSAVIALFPEDLMTVVWFSIVASIVLAVWKKWFH